MIGIEQSAISSIANSMMASNPSLPKPTVKPGPRRGRNDIGRLLARLDKLYPSIMFGIDGEDSMCLGELMYRLSYKTDSPILSSLGQQTIKEQRRSYRRFASEANETELERFSNFVMSEPWNNAVTYELKDENGVPVPGTKVLVPDAEAVPKGLRGLSAYRMFTDEYSATFTDEPEEKELFVPVNPIWASW